MSIIEGKLSALTISATQGGTQQGSAAEQLAADVRKDLEKLVSISAAREMELQHLRGENGRLRTDLASFQGSTKHLAAENQRLKYKLEANTAPAQLQQQRDDLLRENAQLKREKTALEQTEAQLRQQVAALNTEVATYFQWVQSMQGGGAMVQDGAADAATAAQQHGDDDMVE